MSFKRITFFAATLGLAAGLAHADPTIGAAAAEQTAPVTVDHPASVTIQPDTATVTSVDAATTTLAIATSPAIQERDEFIAQSGILIQNAHQLADKLDANLKNGTLHGYQRKDLENLQNRTSEAEATTLKFQRASVDTLVKDRKAAEKAMDEFEEAYFPAAALYEDARQQEESEVQAQITQLEQHKSSLETTAGATKLSSSLKGDVKQAEDNIAASIRASQRNLGKLQAAKNHRWASLRKETQDTYDKTDLAYHQTIERLTRPS